MAKFKMPLSGDVAQAIWTAFMSPFNNQVGLINISLGESKAPDVEREVLDEVGSYGRQLGQIGDAVAVLMKYAQLPAGMPEPETKAIYALKIMLDDIAAVKERPPAPGVTRLNQLVTTERLQTPAVIAAAGEKASFHFLEYFATQIINEHTREAYTRAVREFCAWLEEKGAPSIESVSSVHVGAYFKMLRDKHPRQAPYVKQRLAAVRSLLDWLAGKGVLAFNPASAVRGPKHVVKRGKTAVLAPDEARQLLDTIDVSTPIGLRDRALIGLMVYSFARIGAAVAMTVDDVFVQNRRLHVRLREKGGKDVALPCHHNLETYLHAYLDGAGIATDRDGPLFRTIGRGTGRLTRTALSRVNAYDMVRRRALAAGIATDICNHTFRATGITAYLKNGGTLEKAAAIANHASTRTTQLYDRRSEDVSLDEVERILI